MGSSPKMVTSPTQIRVLSVDDHALIREGIAAARAAGARDGGHAGRYRPQAPVAP